VAWSCEGRWVATTGWDGTARVWDAQTGKEERCLEVRTHPCQILFSPDNEFVVVAYRTVPGKERVVVCNRRTGEQVHEFPGVNDHCPLLCAAFSPDGNHLASRGLGTAHHPPAPTPPSP